MKRNFYQYYFDLLIILDDHDDNVNLRHQFETFLTFT